MNFDAELSRFNPDPALREWVSGTVDALVQRLQDNTLHTEQL